MFDFNELFDNKDIENNSELIDSLEYVFNSITNKQIAEYIFQVIKKYIPKIKLWNSVEIAKITIFLLKHDELIKDNSPNPDRYYNSSSFII